MTLDLTTLEASMRKDEELANAATPGPWSVTHDSCAQCRKEGRAEYDVYEIPGGYHAKFDRKEDAAFIAHARTALSDRVKDCRQLMDLVEALRISEAALNDAVRSEVDLRNRVYVERVQKAEAAQAAAESSLAAKQIALDEAFAVIERQRASLAEAVRALEQYGEHQVGCEAKRSYHRACTCGYSAALSSLQPRKDTP